MEEKRSQRPGKTARARSEEISSGIDNQRTVDSSGESASDRSSRMSGPGGMGQSSTWEMKEESGQMSKEKMENRPEGRPTVSRQRSGEVEEDKDNPGKGI